MEVATKVMANNFAPDTIFLVGESEGELACTVAMGENLEDWEGVRIGRGKGGVNAKGYAEVLLKPPHIGSGGMAVWRDSGSCRFLENAEIKVEAISELSGQSVQEVGCG